MEEEEQLGFVETLHWRETGRSRSILNGKSGGFIDLDDACSCERELRMVTRGGLR